MKRTMIQGQVDFLRKAVSSTEVAKTNEPGSIVKIVQVRNVLYSKEVNHAPTGGELPEQTRWARVKVPDSILTFMCSGETLLRHMLASKASVKKSAVGFSAKINSKITVRDFPIVRRIEVSTDSRDRVVSVRFGPNPPSASTVLEFSKFDQPVHIRRPGGM